MNDTNDLLDQTLDDIADLPEFKPYSAGTHKVLVTFESKSVNNHPCVEVGCKMIETVELAEPTGDEAPAPGATANTLCMLDNEFGAGMFKKLATPIGEALGTANLREIVEQTNDIECVIVSSIKLDKNDKSVERMNIKELYVV